jgi:DNA (cytosine-5)-methyltransferase 1
MERINGLDLFSGIGGLSLALSEWTRPIAYCENDRYAQAVLASRMSDKMLHNAPIWDDVRTLTANDLPVPIDIIYGGFPCQDISAAGLGAGLGGERSGLYWELHRLVGEIRPTFVFLENVPAIRTRGLGDVVRSFTELGYDCRWTVVSAAEVGAPHLRKRWFLLAHANGLQLREEQRAEQPSSERPLLANDNGPSESLANANGERGRAEPWTKQKGSDEARNGHKETSSASWWETEPNVGRVADGVPARVDRLRGLGNSVVPLQAKTAFERLMEL